MNAHKIGVLLLNMGGPERLEEVWPFLFRLFKDPDILPLPRFLRFFSTPLSLLIATMRAPKSKEGYARIGGGSPQRRTAEEVARKLEEALADRGIPALVRVAMRYWKPFTEEALQALSSEGVKAILLLPLYPQYSTTTTMSSIKEFWRIYFKLGLKLPVQPLLRYSLDPRYLALVQARLKKTLEKVSLPREKVAILFSAHSIPMDRVEELGDPYPQEIEAMAKALEEALPREYRFALGYQSKLGPVRWLEPSTEEAIRRLAGEGIQGIVVVPVSFTSEHIETLDEIAIGYRELARSLGIQEFHLVPTVQAEEDFIHYLATLVEEQLHTPSPVSCLRGLSLQECPCLNYGMLPSSSFAQSPSPSPLPL